MLGIILGNGPSKQFYDRSGDCVIGCNIPSEEFSVDATVICDVEIVYLLATSPELVQCPVIVSTKAWEKMKELRIDHYFDIRYVFQPKDWHNTAHYAAEFLLEHGDFDSIHIWGCDSIFSDTTESSTDKFVKKENTKDQKFIKNWRRVWDEIFNRYPNIDFNTMRIEK